MASILLVKTSSLGDVVHNLPVVSDIRKHMPGARIDWVLEEPYAELASLHPGLTSVIPVALRRWRTCFWQRQVRREFGAFRKRIGETRYDYIIDTQGLLKSALLCRMARGTRHGYDRLSAREPLAAALYDQRHNVTWGQHAVSRNRNLAALCLGLSTNSDPDYGIARAPGGSAGTPYCVLLHGSARPSKLWPVASWRALVTGLGGLGYRCVLPWGTGEELAGSRSIAADFSHAIVPGKMSLSAVAELLAGASAVIGVDTGLVHLAVALGRPTIALFTGHDRQSRPETTGIFGASSGANLGGVGDGPAPGEVLALVERLVLA